MTNHWLEALKLWNDDKIYTIPKKGTKEYLEVKKLMEALKKKEKKLLFHQQHQRQPQPQPLLLK